MKMLRDFKLKIDNFGPINEADLDISKINIIAGQNASGKTTLSKLIYCIFTAFSTDGEYLAYESMKDRLNFMKEHQKKLGINGQMLKLALLVKIFIYIALLKI